MLITRHKFLRILLVSIFALLSGCRMVSGATTEATSQAAATKTQQAAQIPTDTSPADLPPLADTALFIDGVTLRISSVEKAASYQSEFTSDYTPTSPTDSLLIIEAEVGDAATAVIDSWEGQVTLLDKVGRSSQPQITETSASENGTIQNISWVFVVSKSSPAFLLKLPDGQSLPLNDLSK
jgi:hypothetical protein